jgi:hypothetical protein
MDVRKYHPRYHRSMKNVRRLALLLPSALLGVACAPAALLPYRPEQPPTVSLPATVAGITDARTAFAALFDAELRTAGDAGQAAWLHGAGSGQAPVDTSLAVATEFAARAPGTSVLVVGGLFGDCLGARAVPFGDGVIRAPGVSLDEGYRQYDDLGLRAIRRVPVPGRASAEANGRLVAEAIRAEAIRQDVQRIVVIGYSKGIVDTLHALALLQGEGGVPSRLTAVVSVAGAVSGSPLADHYQTAYEAISPWVTPFDCTPSQGGDMDSLTRRVRLAWLVANRLPAGVAYYSIVAHAPLDEMAPPLRVTSRQLAAIDPRNDGQLIAAEMVLPGSTLLAEARADHWDVAIPRDRDPNPVMRASTSGRGYPREALFRATLKWVVAAGP